MCFVDAAPNTARQFHQEIGRSEFEALRSLFSLLLGVNLKKDDGLSRQLHKLVELFPIRGIYSAIFQHERLWTMSHAFKRFFRVCLSASLAF